MSVIEQSGEFAIRSLLKKKRRLSHNLIVSQKLKALTSKKWPLYRATQGNVQIVVYKGNYYLGIFPSKVSQYVTVGSSTV